MAGSLNHITDLKDGKFSYREDLIENLGDAYEALEECFYIIMSLVNYDLEQLNAQLAVLHYPLIEEKEAE